MHGVDNLFAYINFQYILNIYEVFTPYLLIYPDKYCIYDNI